jgi:4-amino-4-deoxy-L-arabinose transferase-like glycosyltransferase
MASPAEPDVAAPEPTELHRASPWLVVLALAMLGILLGTALIGPYGLFHDELYYWACSRRFGLGYVDHPPLAPWILGLSMPLLGEGWLGFGLLPALCGAATLWLTGQLARRLGAGAFGQLLAGTCALTAPFYLAFFSFYSVNAFEILFWTLAGGLVLERLRTGERRLWLGLGALAGIALLNKHTFAIFGAGLGVALLATPLRADLRTPWPWLGAAGALLLTLPNFLWNAALDWPSWAFYQSVGAEKNLRTPPAEALLFQVVGMNPAALLVWLPGLAFLLFSKKARPFRPLGVLFLVLLLVMLFSGQRRGDRIAGAYPLVLAAGAALWDRSTRGSVARRARWALPAAVLGLGVLMTPISLPVLSPEATARYFEAIDESPEIEAGDAGHAIPLQLLGRLEWERLAGEVIAQVEAMTAEERAQLVILTPHWVLASVVEYYGRHRSLPPVVSPHNAYSLWRDEAAGREVALAVGIETEVLERDFAEVLPLATFRCEYCASWRQEFPYRLAFGPRRPIEALLAEWQHFGSGPALSP